MQRVRRWLVISALVLGALSVRVWAGDLTRLELKQRANSHMSWVIPAPIKDAFDAYQEYADTHFAVGGFLWAKGSKITKSLEDGKGEISMRLEGNPFSKGVFFLIELRAIGDQTQVDYYFANSHWRRNGEKLSKLFPQAVPNKN